MASIVQNTNKDYPCIMCGGPGNIVREDPVNPRLKCRQCNFMYDGKDSVDLKERGEIPSGPPVLPKEPEPVKESPMIGEHARVNATTDSNSKCIGDSISPIGSIPRNPTHLFVTKNRRTSEFATDKTFKKVLLRWEASSKGYDVFQLMKFEYSVKVDVVK